MSILFGMGGSVFECVSGRDLNPVMLVLALVLELTCNGSLGN